MATQLDPATPPDWPDPATTLDRAGVQAASVAQTIMHAVNLVGVLARPEQLAGPIPREHVLEHLDALLGVLPKILPTFCNVGTLTNAAKELRTACANWEDGTSIPPAVQQAALRVLAVMGIR